MCTTMKIDIYNTDKRYSIIYADPPWQYGDKLNNDSAWGGIRYKTMPTQDIYAMGGGDKASFGERQRIVSLVYKPIFERGDRGNRSVGIYV